MANVNEKKITKAMKFGAVAEYFNSMDANTSIGVVAVKSGDAMVEVAITASMIADAMTHEVELLSKKNNGDGKPSKLQLENAKLTEAVYEGMEDGKAYTITDIIKTIPAVAGLNISKVRPLMNPLLSSGKVKREEVKGKPMFTKVG